MPVRHDLGGPAPEEDATFAPRAVVLPTINPVNPTLASSPTPGQGLALDEAGLIPAETLRVPVYAADPANAKAGQVWYRSDTSQLSIRHDSTTTKRVTFA